MSNIYIQEPPTSGKVLLKTTVGDLEIELWTREAPLACRNFIQLCMENYYKNTIFHRLVKDFIVQGGDPTGTGEGGESVYGHPFKDEFHTRLRFCRRGLVAMANAGKDDNGSQFFFTLGPTQELQNKHTIFGKVAGDTIYNMIKLGEGLVDEDERPLYPQKILSAEVLHNPFSDIVPRKLETSKESEKETKKKAKTAAVKNFKLLSFGEEAEEDEEETIEVNKKFAGKGKSAHDTLADPKLSAQTAVEVAKAEESHEEEDEVTEIEKKGMTDRIKNKLLSKKAKVVEVEAEDEEEEEDYLGKADKDAQKKKLEEIKQDIRKLKKEVKNDNKEKELKEIKKAEQEKEENQLTEDKKEYLESQSKYKLAQANIPKKGKSKDELASKMLAKFKNTLHDIKDKIMDEEEEQKELKDDIEDDSWMRHTFQTEDELPVLAKDASTKGDDWFEIYDPRNPMNKRRRGEKTDKAKRLRK